MSSLLDNLSNFLRECRNSILCVVSDNTNYKALSLKKAEMYELLQAETPPEARPLLIETVDLLSAVCTIDVSHSYLCGFRGEDKRDSLADYEPYSSLRAEFAAKSGQLNFDSACQIMFDTFLDSKYAMTNIERVACYYGGLHDNKRLSALLDSPSADEWRELMDRFI